jgi:hypothetical protein
MQARCPRCASIFNTDRSGLQFCPNCGQQVDVPPFPGSSPESSAAGWGGPTGPGGPGSMGPGPAVREDTPWERRATVGFFTGLFETWKRTIFSPQHFWPSVKPGGSWIDALLYAWIMFTLGRLISAPLGRLGFGRFGYEQVQQVLEQMQQLPPESREMIRQFVTGTTGVAQLVASVILYPLGIIIGAAILHLCCLLFGAAKSGYYATFRVVGYAAATTVISGTVPCLGFLAFLYGLILMVLGIASVQETTLGKAAGAVLLPFVLLLCCGCIVVMLAGAGLAAMLGHLQTQ